MSCNPVVTTLTLDPMHPGAGRFATCTIRYFLPYTPIVIVIFIFVYLFGRRGFCYWGCWINPIISASSKLGQLFHMPSLFIRREYMQNFEYRKADSLQEAFKLVSVSKGSVFMAGGTDILVRIKEKSISPKQVVDLKCISGMSGIEVSEEEICIGALTTIRALEISKDVREKIPILSQAASKLGSVQVRNKATIGGNLCNAAPSAETAPALLALEAKAEIYGSKGVRVVDMSEFFRGPGISVLEDGEVLKRLKIPLLQKRFGSVYYNVSTRKAMDIAFVGVAVIVVLGEGSCINKARIALGAVSPTPIRAQAAENVLEGAVINPERAMEAAELAAQACNPISDQRASAEYRREMVRNLCYRGLLKAYGDAMDSNGSNGR
jgi:carbon-monoxide dehydrogenase medium subunit